MQKKCKLVIGDRVRARFLGGPSICTVIAVNDNRSYKLQMYDKTIIPNCFWREDADRKAPWYIEEYIGNTLVVKSDMNQNISEHTTSKDELKRAIDKQKKFIRGQRKTD